MSFIWIASEYINMKNDWIFHKIKTGDKGY